MYFFRFKRKRYQERNNSFSRVQLSAFSITFDKRLKFMSKEVYLVDGVRTPIGSFGGSLSPVRADDLAAIVLKALVERHPNLDLSLIHI
jgi:hypothetical protein